MNDTWIKLLKYFPNLKTKNKTKHGECLHYVSVYVKNKMCQHLDMARRQGDA